MTAVAMSDLGGEYARIFGQPQTAQGRSRLCKVCGDWHRLSVPWPHNCRAESPPRARHLAAPQLAPKFEPFVAGTHDEPVVIGDPRDKRAYMERHDLVDYDAGVQPDRAPTALQWEAELAADFAKAEQTDPLSRAPLEIIGRTDLEGAAEIDHSTIEIAK